MLLLVALRGSIEYLPQMKIEKSRWFFCWWDTAVLQELIVAVEALSRVALDQAQSQRSLTRACTHMVCARCQQESVNEVRRDGAKFGDGDATGMIHPWQKVTAVAMKCVAL